MSRVAVFGGTTEGRALSRQLAAAGIAVELFVATGYGEDMIAPMDGLAVHRGRLDACTMAARLADCDCVVDATHPYAVEVTENIRKACIQADKRYLRLQRGESAAGNVHEVANNGEAVALLCRLPGRVLLTLGSKSLADFTAIPDWRERLVARVLPSVEVMTACALLGFLGKNLICMQGPFTHEMNVATLEQTGANILVTKDSGREGGFFEKLSAAQQTGTAVVVVRRPVLVEEGYTFEQISELLLGCAKPAPFTQQDPRFPLFVSLTKKPVLVVGGGRIAQRRVQTLLEFGARITVVAPALTPTLQALSAEGRLHWVAGCYDGRMQGFDLAVAATNDRAVNRWVGETAQTLHIPVSVADCREECSFYFPAVVFADNVVAGVVSTDGDHAKVKKIAVELRAITANQPLR